MGLRWFGNDTDAVSRFSYKQFKVNIEDIDIHPVHEKSTSNGSIPILLAHGWPGERCSGFQGQLGWSEDSAGSIREFIPVIRPLTESAKTHNGKDVSFHVVAPSLPGLTFSSAPPRKNRTAAVTGRVFNTLMTEVLGYQKHSTHGTDWVKFLHRLQVLSRTETCGSRVLM